MFRFFPEVGVSGKKRTQGEIQDGEFLFNTESRKLSVSQRRFTPMSERELQNIVKNAARRAGIKKWENVTPTSLRKVFDSALRNQPQEVRLDTKDQEFLIGHLLPGSQDNYYDPTKIEEMREKFSRLIFEPGKAQGRMLDLSEMAEILGLEFQAILTEARERAGREPSRDEIKEALKKRVKQVGRIKEVKKEYAIVPEGELDAHLQDGWEYTQVLPSGKILLSKTVEVEGQDWERNGEGGEGAPDGKREERYHPHHEIHPESGGAGVGKCGGGLRRELDSRGKKRKRAGQSKLEDFTSSAPSPFPRTPPSPYPDRSRFL